MYTNTWITEEEAKTFGVSEEERRFLFRVDSAKVNLAPPSAAAQWFKLVGVKLDNGEQDSPQRRRGADRRMLTPPGRKIIAVWVKNEVLIMGTYYDEKERKRRLIVLRPILSRAPMFALASVVARKQRFGTFKQKQRTPGG
jgi:hypothetical protein